MNQFLNQFKKDFRQTFINPVFFLMGGFCFALWGFIFPRMLFRFARVAGVPSFSGGGGGLNIYEHVFNSYISYTHILLLFIVPVFTMRLIAEEKKLRTFDLLLTAPITSTKIVLAKFFAAYAVVLILLGCSLIHPMMTIGFVDFNVNLLLSAYLSIALLMAVYTAIGLFSSSLSSSIMLSVFLGVAFTVSLHFVGMGSQFSNKPIYTSVMEYLSVSTHLGHFFRGNIMSSSILFFIIVTGFFVFLTQRVIESSRWRVQ